MLEHPGLAIDLAEKLQGPEEFSPNEKCDWLDDIYVDDYDKQYPRAEKGDPDLLIKRYVREDIGLMSAKVKKIYKKSFLIAARLLREHQIKMKQLGLRQKVMGSGVNKEIGRKFGSIEGIPRRMDGVGSLDSRMNMLLQRQLSSVDRMRLLTQIQLSAACGDMEERKVFIVGGNEQKKLITDFDEDESLWGSIILIQNEWSEMAQEVDDLTAEWDDFIERMNRVLSNDVFPDDKEILDLLERTLLEHKKAYRSVPVKADIFPNEFFVKFLEEINKEVDKISSVIVN